MDEFALIIRRHAPRAVLVLLGMALAGCQGEDAGTSSGSTAPAPAVAQPSAAPASAPKTNAPEVADTAAAYTACAACHLPTGNGVPGAFPPIRNRAAAIARLDGGREYLISVVAHGLMGQISVEGKTYMGVMPGHAGSMDDAQIAAAVNHAIFSLSDEPPEDIAPVTAAEAEAQRTAIASPSPTSAMQMRQQLVQKHGQAWP